MNIKSLILSIALVGSLSSFAAATSLPFNDQVTYSVGKSKRIESQPSWLVPEGAKFKSIDRGYGGLKILLSAIGTVGCFSTMIVAREELTIEPFRQKLNEFKLAANTAFEMALIQMKQKKLLEASEVDFENQIFRSLGYNPQTQQTQPLLTGTQTIDSIAYPGDKVTASDDSDCLPGASMPDLSNYPAVLYYGPQGSGKTFAAEQEVVRRREAGHRIIAIDPHAGFNSWKGAEVIGAGMDYEAIDAQLAWLATEIKKRYKQIRNEPNPIFQPLTIVCDEFTNWGSRCKSSADFFQAALSDVRKAQCFILLISHARTLAGLGKAAGFADSRDAGLLEIEFLVNLDANGKASPKYQALVKSPGTALSDRFAVSIAKIEHKSADSEPSDKVSTGCTGNLRNLPDLKPEKPGNPYGIGAEAVEACVSDALKEPGKCPIFSNSELSDEQKKEAAKIIILQNLGVENTILILWGLRSGGRNHRLYVEAREMLDRLIKEKKDD